MKKILLVATSPLCIDGLTKIEMDVIEYNRDVIKFDFAYSYGLNNVYGKRLKNWDIKCYNIPPRKNIFGHIYALQKIVNEGKYDAVYIHGNSPMMILEALPAKIGHASRVITHCHSSQSKFPLIRYIVKPFFNALVDVKIASSEYSAKWAYDGNRVQVIVNGINIQQYKFDKNVRKRVRKELNCEDSLLIGHVGRFTEVKNHKKVVEIFSKIIKYNPKAKLLLIGEGELKRKIKKQVSSLNLDNHVIFLEETDQIVDYYQAMDLLLLPSLYEGLCLVSIEAQANGMPVVMSNKLTPETYATDNAYAIDLKESAENWAYKILNSIPIQRNENSVEQLYNKGFDINKMMDKVQNILLNI